MPKKREHNLIVTHTFANGVTITGAEFDEIAEREGGFLIDYELNKEWYQEAQRVLDPNYTERERQRRRFERTEKRRQELAAEAERIQRELEGL